jgi:hypothetical protein
LKEAVPDQRSSLARKQYNHTESQMQMNVIWRNVALMVAFGAMAWLMFTENVRTVQILGLFACGAVFGAGLTSIVAAIRGRQKQA